MSKQKIICLVTSSHISTNPRLVKEAEALTAAGFEVRVITLDVNERLRTIDLGMAAPQKWKLLKVNRGNQIGYAFRTILQRVARQVIRLSFAKRLQLAKYAHHRLIGRLARAATSIRADLYIAHNLAALPAAAAAAKANGGRLGFDAEDFHTEELADDQRNYGDQIARQVIEKVLLPRCHHLTASSPLIAEAYFRKNAVRMTTVLNVFPLSQAPAVRARKSALSERSLYWFSQTVGPGRGLEAIVSAMAYMGNAVRLYLRGNEAAGYRDSLLQRARQAGVGSQINFLPMAQPEDMVRLAASHSIGLALELNDPPNRAICLTNKAFTYLLAGIPVLFSRTAAQEQLASQLGEAAMVVDLDEPKQIADVLGDFFSDSDRQKRARKTAWRLGRERFNWETEREKFLSTIKETFSAI